ncbi:unnamed protein product [Amaranthus hypochondriacus]
MSDSPQDSTPTCNFPNNRHNQIGSNKTDESDLKTKIPVEIVSDEEMAFIESAFSLAAAALRRPSSSFLRSTTSLESICFASNRGFSNSVISDVEDLGQFKSPQMKKIKISDSDSDSFLSKFRKKRGLSVTDLTATEWCEKQMEFVLRYGKQKKTNAMKAGIIRHEKLEEEISRKVEVRVETLEDKWAVNFIKFIICANQLLFHGLTREMPILGFVQGVWMVGIIDELRMPVPGNDRNLILVDTKTRTHSSPPAEPQRRNGRLQLMYYKYLWDNLIFVNFPSEQFYEFFSMDPQRILSDDVKMNASNSGFPAETLAEVVKYFINVCSALPPAHDQLLLRYEFQKDFSLICEDEFSYNEDLVKAQIHDSLEFWRGERNAKFVSEMEKWKCNYCQFTCCPKNPKTEPNSQSSTHED